MTDACRTCGDAYADGGDGYDGECPGCADATDAIETTVENLQALRKVLRETSMSMIPGGFAGMKVDVALTVQNTSQGPVMVSVLSTRGDPAGFDDQTPEKASLMAVLTRRIDDAIFGLEDVVPTEALPVSATYGMTLHEQGSTVTIDTLKSKEWMFLNFPGADQIAAFKDHLEQMRQPEAVDQPHP